MENKKIKGATAVDLGEIHFKSKLERSCYIKLREAGFTVLYEPEKFRIWPGGRLQRAHAYQPSKKNRKEVEAITRPLLPITYTPDFKVRRGNIVAYFDAKGYANDRYPMKKKMFLEVLDNRASEDNLIYLFFEVHSVSQVLHSIKIIQNMTQLERIKSLTQELPDKDKELGHSFIEKRDFKSLWELVHSCLIRIRRNEKKENPNPEYLDLDVEKLRALEAEVGNYQSLIEPNWMDEFGEDALDEETPSDEEY